MYKAVSIRGLNITFSLRHIFEKKKPGSTKRTNLAIEIWFKRDNIVGAKEFSRPEKWGKNYVGQYAIGIYFLFFHAWVMWDYGGMHLEI